jgi:hypothetical protein
LDLRADIEGKADRRRFVSMTKQISTWAALVAAGLGVAAVIRAQEPTPTPAAAPSAAAAPEAPATLVPVVEPTAIVAPEVVPVPTQTPSPDLILQPSPTPAREAALPCAPSPARGFFSRPQVPLPPELQRDLAIVKSGAIRISGKAPSLKPWVVKELAFGPKAEASAGFNLAAFHAAFGFEVLALKQNFSFRLTREDTPGAPPVAVRCAWGGAMRTGNVDFKSFGVEMRVPQGNSTLCELSDEPGGEPWRLFLWVGPPSNLVPPEFPSGGGLVRGEIRYEAASTNAIKPAILGLKPTVITGTFFTKEGQTVAAIERLVPLRVLMKCSVPAAEQAVFVAVGAALYIRDGTAGAIDY